MQTRAIIFDVADAKYLRLLVETDIARLADLKIGALMATAQRVLGMVEKSIIHAIPKREGGNYKKRRSTARAIKFHASKKPR